MNGLYQIPAGTSPAICRGKGCGAQIFWIRPEGRGPVPVNADGTSHFSTCPDAADFRRRQAAARPVSGSTASSDDELEDLRSYFRADQRILAIAAKYHGTEIPEDGQMVIMDMVEVKKMVTARRSVR